MSPGLLGTEVSATPPQYFPSTMEDSLFPPIARKSVISIDSEADPTDFCNNQERHVHTRGSVPNSLASSPIKFPTIDRANSTSIASLPGSRSTRHRTHTRDIRASYSRSPSCPSHLDISRDFDHVDFAVFRHDPLLDNSKKANGGNQGEKTRLPNIFSTDYNSLVEKSKQSPRRDKTRDRANALSIRRSESLVNALSGNSETGSLTSREPLQRQNQTAALLLPIRTETQTNKKKKKRRSKVTLDSSENDDFQNTPRNMDSEEIVMRRRITKGHEDALDAIARENETIEEDEHNSPRAIEMNSSRKVKQWIKNNASSQKENEVKA